MREILPENNLKFHLGKLIRDPLKKALFAIFGRRLLRTLESRAGRVAIEVTNLCNANCSFCAYRYQQRPVEIMSLDTFKQFLDKYVVYGGGELKFTPIVGDPLLDRGLTEKIEYARQFPEITLIYTYTNGIAFNKLDLDRFLKSGIDTVQISTCIGSQAMFERLYGVKKYSVTIENIVQLLELNASLGSKVDIRISIRADKPYEAVWNSTDYQRLAALYGRSIPILNDAYDSWSGLIKKDEIPIGQKWRRIPRTKKSEPCSLLYKGLTILADGRVNACWARDMEASLIVGDIHSQALEDIWKGSDLRALREKWKKGELPEVCRKCNQYTSLSDFLADEALALVTGRKL